MTSMLLTSRTAAAALAVEGICMFVSGLPRRRGRAAAASLLRERKRLARCGLLLLAAIDGRDLLLRRVLRSAFVDHLAHQRAITRHVAGQRHEFRAVPFLELDHPGAFMVEATRLHWREKTGGAQLLDARLGKVQVLEPPAHLVGRHHLALAELGLRIANGLDDQDPVGNAAGVINRALPRRILEIALADC